MIYRGNVYLTFFFISTARKMEKEEEIVIEESLFSVVRLFVYLVEKILSNCISLVLSLIYHPVI